LIENRSSPRASVIPVLAYASVGEATDWLCEAFGLTVRLRTFSQSIADVDPASWGGTLVASA
jgi:hypothetical protein